MANLVRSLGYSLGKVHTGLVAYLCDLYREGVYEPLESFFGAIGVRVPAVPIPRREWKSVDLAIFDGNVELPRIILEVKVDDHEGGTSDENCQTRRYAKAWPSCDAYLFVTLGMGEYYHPPRSDRFTWIRIRNLLAALECVKTPHDIIQQWTEEVRREVALQVAASHAARPATPQERRDCRAGSWNIYLLGRLAEELEPTLRAESLAVETTCYAYGTRPDTILNFGWKGREYAEVNCNGRLNLKIALDEPVEKREAIDRAIQACQAAPYEIAPRLHLAGKVGASKTFASFDIGLASDGETLYYEHSPDETRRRLLSVLRVFYRR